jgi:diguanylate cyclase (GGDEF)-like protein
MKKKKLSLPPIREKLLKTFQNNNSVLGESALINTHRLFYLAIIAIPLRIINIFIITSSTSHDTQILRVWSQGIIASHFILLIFMIGFFLATLKLRKRTEPNTAVFVLQYLSVIVIMAAGVAIVTIDQLVTYNITPFLLTCIVCGTVFLIRPLISFIIYSATYLAYYFLIALTITNQEMLLSNRVNGITAIGIGLLLSIILWNYSYTNITQKRRIEMQQKQLEQMAYYDSLTDLPNRRLFEKLIEQELASMHRHGHESVVIMLDIDDFKSINDTYGHPVGDEILRQLAHLLNSNIRKYDTVSRFGGEEFIILMPKTSLEGGAVFAERLRKLIMEEKFIVGSITLQITCSFGVSLLSVNEGQDSEDCYFLADKSLYKAKQSGKNRVEIAEGSLGMADKQE